MCPEWGICKKIIPLANKPVKVGPYKNENEHKMKNKVK